MIKWQYIDKEVLDDMSQELAHQVKSMVGDMIQGALNEAGWKYYNDHFEEMPELSNHVFEILANDSRNLVKLAGEFAVKKVREDYE